MTQAPRLRTAAAATATVVAAAALWVASSHEPRSEAPSFQAQWCGLPQQWRLRVRRGYHPDRSGQISLLPATPSYMASGGGGWSHSGPWKYLQHVPLVFYAPGRIPGRVIDRPVTLADVPATLARTMGAEFEAPAGRALREVLPALSDRNLRLIVTIVWDGGGWNTLRQWPDEWPNLRRMMRTGVSYRNATVGSSPSVTPAVHTTLGTGAFPNDHGITGVPVRDERGEVVDAFLKGESARFIRRPTLAQEWDEQMRQRALVAMVGYEPWHLGMIGKGAEEPGGDRDHAAWLNVKTNEWTTNPQHYELPRSLTSTEGLAEEVDELDAADGIRDRAWGSHEILDSQDRLEETPAFITYHTKAMIDVLNTEGYGRDRVTDLLYTNYKQIDRVGHYFNMAAPEVRESLGRTDQELGRLVAHLNREVGRGEWMIVLTADHGQQPDAPVVGGVGLDPNEIESDVAEVFGPVVRAVWPTEVFLDDKQMREHDVEVVDVARWLGGYSLAENSPESIPAGLSADDRAFDLVVPGGELANFRC